MIALHDKVVDPIVGRLVFSRKHLLRVFITRRLATIVERMDNHLNHYDRKEQRVRLELLMSEGVTELDTCLVSGESLGRPEEV